MPRHVPDDFSFLPTVDSMDDEDVVKEELWSASPPVEPSPAPEPRHDAVESFHAEEPQHEDPPPLIAPPAPVAVPPQISVKAPAAPQKIRTFEPDHANDAVQSGRAMWEAFAADQGIDAPTIVTPKPRPAPLAEPRQEIEPVVPGRAEPRTTAGVSFGRGNTESHTVPVAPAPLSRVGIPYKAESPKEQPPQKA
jgi:hypothetical protein